MKATTQFQGCLSLLDFCFWHGLTVVVLASLELATQSRFSSNMWQWSSSLYFYNAEITDMYHHTQQTLWAVDSFASFLNEKMRTKWTKPSSNWRGLGSDFFGLWTNCHLPQQVTAESDWAALSGRLDLKDRAFVLLGPWNEVTGSAWRVVLGRPSSRMLSEHSFQ